MVFPFLCHTRRRCPYPRSGLGGREGNRSKMGVSPTSSEVPRTFREGGAQPLPGRRGGQGSARDYFLQGRHRHPYPSSVHRLDLSARPLVPEKISGRPHWRCGFLQAGSSLTVTGEGVPPKAPWWALLWQRTLLLHKVERQHETIGIIHITHEASSPLRLLAVSGPRDLVDNVDDPCTVLARRIVTRRAGSIGRSGDWQSLRHRGSVGDPQVVSVASPMRSVVPGAERVDAWSATPKRPECQTATSWQLSTFKRQCGKTPSIRKQNDGVELI